MTVQLNQQDFRRIVDLLQALPEFGSARDRRRLVAAALEGAPRADVILGGLDLEGAPRSAAITVVKTLADFGQVVYGKEALGVLLNYLQDITDVEQSDFIAGLFGTYPLRGDAAARNMPIGQWRGDDSPAEVREKIIGENTLRDIRVLELALEAAKAVVRIGLPKGAGTGFMIAPELLITNHHVIASTAALQSAEFLFNYELDRDNRAREPIIIKAAPNGIFHTNPELDFTVIELQDVHDFGQPVQLRSMVVRPDERVSIVQHPGGHFKKISMQNNFVAYADRRVVQYTTSTLPGSSGSPVFNDAFEVIAIHHSGGMLEEPGSGKRFMRNAGTSMVAVIEDLRFNASRIYDRAMKPDSQAESR